MIDKTKVQTLNEIRKQFIEGQEVNVKPRTDTRRKNEDEISGVIDEIYPNFMLVKTSNYKVCVMFKEILNGDSIVICT